MSEAPNHDRFEEWLMTARGEVALKSRSKEDLLASFLAGALWKTREGRDAEITEDRKEWEKGGEKVDKYRPDGGPAFPVFGMTLRDWFAGQALVGIVTSIKWPQLWSDFRIDQQEKVLRIDCARELYKLADAVLKERDKK